MGRIRPHPVTSKQDRECQNALEDPLNTKNAKAGDRFRARTIEPIPTLDGSVIAPGLEIVGHVDKWRPHTRRSGSNVARF